MPPGRAQNTGAPGGPRGRRAPQPLDQRARALGGRRQLRGGGPQREAVGVAGVDAAEERVDEVFEHVVAEPGADELADARVVVGAEGPAGSVGLGGHPVGGVGAHEGRALELGAVGGHARARGRRGGGAAAGPAAT